MSVSVEEVPDTEGTDPFSVRIPAVGCPRCPERFQRPEDLEVHLERHRPVRVTSKEERAALAHCPKGCGRWIEALSPDGAAHATLCDGAPPITKRKSKMAYRWWCDEHQFGTNGPRPWGDHKREHHSGEVPRVMVKKKADVVGAALGLLHQERSRITIEKSRLTMELSRINAAIKALETDLQPVLHEVEA